MCDGERKYLWRQIFVMSAAAFHSVAISFMLSFPGVINPAILNPNSTDIRATSDQASWIAASNGLSGILGFLINSYIMEKFGRRIDFILLNSALIVSWITIVLAGNVATLITARVIQGIATGGLFINSLIVGEYSHPSRRGYFTSMKRCALSLGVLLCHGLTLHCSWRQISAIAIIPASLSLIIIVFWPESPPYLALKGRYKECEKSFTWLHGTSAERRIELKELIQAQKEKKRKQAQTKIFDQLRDRIFWKSFFIVAIVTVVLDTSGQ